MKKKTKPAKKSAGHWANCFLEQATRETAWAAASAGECNHLAAHEALVRRQVWLHAALLAKEQNK